MTILKNTHFFAEKNSTSRKFDPFVSRTKVPGERVFEFVLGFWLLCTPIANAQPWTSWKVPETLGPDRWQVNLSQGIVLLSSPHSNWLYAYSSGGGLLWKRSLSWPMTQEPPVQDGLLLLQQKGQPAILLQPETGELRQRLDRQFSGWAVVRDGKSWLRLGSDGQLSLGSPDWTQWQPKVQLRLDLGDQWLGPPVISGSAVYLATSRGQMQRVDLNTWKSRRLPPIQHPLLSPQPHPDGVMEVSADGLLTLIREGSSWVQRFPGQGNCYSREGEILARPCVDDAGNIYLATRLTLMSWDVNGKLRWSKALSCTSPVRWHQRSCYLVDGSPALLRLSDQTGEVVERTPLSARPTGQLAIEKQLLALALANGEVLVRSAP